MAATPNNQYDESAFRVLEGLEPVKLRPGMYTRTDSPTHIVQEVIDNAADEALGGFCKTIKVRMYADGSVSVSDDGRGIPVGPHPETGIPVVVLAYTRLHAGGKFDKTSAKSAYAFSGGLHGVGVAVTTALSSRVEVQVKREGKLQQVIFENGGDTIGAIAVLGECGRQTGTTVRVWPDPKYFDTPKVSFNELERLLRSKAVLLPGVTVVFELETPEGLKSQTWRYPGGLADYLKERMGDVVDPVVQFSAEKYAPAGHETFAEGEGASWAIAWYEEGGLTGESYVNLIPTPAGGTHEAGLRAGVFEAVKSFIDHHGLLPRGVKLQQEDVASRMSYVLSTRILDPQFQGQVKERLTSREAVKLVSQMARDPFEIWLNHHVEAGKALAELAIRQAQARSRQAQKVEKKKGSGVAVLPGKLTDCESTDTRENELFLVEGDSAGGSAKQARDKETQAILPLRGKVLNTWEVHPDQIYGNTEIHDIAVAIGVEKHGINDTPDLSGLRYGKIVVMSDADVDGLHIQTLLLTLFFKHFPRLIESGRIFIAQPPLYRIDVPGQGKNKPPRKFYALDEPELNATRDRLIKEGVKPDNVAVSRFKGLGEMNPEQLRETTMAVATRRMLPVRVKLDDRLATMELFEMLMSKGTSEQRKHWMEEKGNTVEVDV